MDDGQGVPAGGGASPDFVVPDGGVWDDSLPFHREDFVRIMSSCLKGMGFKNASKALEEESGHKAEPDDSTPLLLSCVSAGRWEQALTLLSSVQLSQPSLSAQARALLLRQRFLELVEDKRLEEALACLRDDLAPLFMGQNRNLFQNENQAGVGGDVAAAGNPLRTEQLHALSTLLLAPTAVSLRRLSTPGKCWSSRVAARSNARAVLQDLLAEGDRAVVPGRLQHLVAQALQLQTMNCAYHNTPDTKLELLKDHSCGLRTMPQVTTHVLDEHADEVWCCRFSHGGGMLATSSADAVLILWDVDGGGRGARGRRAPALHKRIEVREGAPHHIAWSPDDLSVLTCGASPKITRWDVASGREACVYKGEHTESVTGVAWLREGREFVSSGLDRKVVVWSFGGTMLSCWNCNTHITGLVVSPPPRPQTPPPPSPLYPYPTGGGRGYGGGGGGLGTFPGDIWSRDHCPLRPSAANTSSRRGARQHSNGAGNAGSGSSNSSSTGSPNGRDPDASSSSSPPRPPPPPPPPPATSWPPASHHGGRRSPSSPSLLSARPRRCRVWAICREDTMKALDIEVLDYGEPPPPGAAGASELGHAGGFSGGGVNGASAGRRGRNQRGGGGGGRGATGTGAGAGIEAGATEGNGDDGGSVGGGGRRRRSGSGGAGGGLASPRSSSSGRRKGVGSCTIAEGRQGSFPGCVISGVCAARDWSNNLLLHMDKGRLLSWNSKTNETVKEYDGLHPGRYIVRSTFGGLNDAFVASGSEDSLVYLWHRERKESFATLPGHAGTVNAVHWNPTRPGMLASVSDDQTVRLWEPSLPPPPPPPLPPGDVAEGSGSVPSSPNGTPGSGALGASAAALGSSGGGGGWTASGALSPQGSPRASRRDRGSDRGVGVHPSANARVKTELDVEGEAQRGGGGRGFVGEETGGGAMGKGKGRSGDGSRRKRSTSVGGSSASAADGRGADGEWSYARAPSQGWEAWVGGSGEGEGGLQGGFSAKIAALRW